MQLATPANVLGRFDGAPFATRRDSFVFLRRGDTSIVATGSGARRIEYPVLFTFGLWPLQQYLVGQAGGRVQALFVAWDARASDQGGQRWFSLAPEEEATHAEVARAEIANGATHAGRIDWMGPQYNWNYMCADCHSTAVRKQYEPAVDSFHTSYSAINVGCEACHGPGSEHVRWANRPSLLRRLLWRDSRLTSRLDERRGIQWVVDSAPTAHRSRPRTTDHEIATCTQCHARRDHFADGYVAGAPLLDYYAPLPIVSGLYFPDGQQRDEVYTVASFEQSRMYGAGVTCSDCHDPHTQKLRRPGNTVCTQCHRATAYDTTAHHFHRATSPGAQCVSCHLPDTTYMVIDRRHDHSIRIPRPDQSLALGVPNACNRCHTDHDAAWAAAAIRRWYPKPNLGYQRFASAFHADDRGDPAAGDSLLGIANDSTQPWIVRASALARLGAYPTAAAAQAARRWSRDSNAVVRLYALQVVEQLADTERLSIAAPLLGDPRRAVRQRAAWLIAPVAASLRNSDDRRAFDRAAGEFVASQRYNADRAPSRLGLAMFYAQLGRFDSAAVEFRAGERMDSAAANDLRRALTAAAGQNATAAALLRAVGASR